MDAIHVTQLERDTVLVCLDRKCHLFSGFSTSFSLKYQRLFWNATDNLLLLLLSPDNLKIVNLQGRLKSNKKLASELSFDFCIGSVGKRSQKSPQQNTITYHIVFVWFSVKTGINTKINLSKTSSQIYWNAFIYPALMLFHIYERAFCELSLVCIWILCSPTNDFLPPCRNSLPAGQCPGLLETWHAGKELQVQWGTGKKK